MEDARRPYREIAAAVDRSPPTVSDRIERLQELGIVERFTVEVDRSMLVEGSTVLVELDVEPGEDGTVAETLAERSTVEHVIRTADASVLCSAHTDEDGVRDLLADSIAAGRVRDYSVRLVAQSSWEPTLGEVPVGVECVICGKSVEDDGVSVESGEDPCS
jgi:DNA-binding Lrp family transcriptional regulator